MLKSLKLVVETISVGKQFHSLIKDGRKKEKR